MIAVNFEVEPADGRRDDYLAIAADLRPLLDGIDGFISIERLQSLTDPDRILSMSFWRDEAAILAGQRPEKHRAAQSAGRAAVFSDYRLGVAEVKRGYGMTARDQTPPDSQAHHDAGKDAA
ncbi:antibiotic biosynthesis monooxygenase family protein [Rhodovulum sulfidophilum]|uniref:antibiotic biosynthesis monooxygenase family protein n=1 Tax=Rhodovulum sulfidophilum TaxID=35806 RepID=UPI000951CAEE|nr:antibiotic biosynthesis monooxygenase [Rhodovulum sulfidophilum]OLS53221.1 antibiotic biosynthesis monooxygenase [Rhodovulum sulfidophilum]